MKRTILAVPVMVVLLMLAAPASGQVPPIEGGVTIAVSDVALLCPGDTLTVSGEAAPGGEVVILFDGEAVATTAADAGGGYSVTFDVPAAATGEHTVTALGPSVPLDGHLLPGGVASATVLCVAPAAVAAPAPAVPGLAVTGGNIAMWMVLLAGLLLIGGTALVMGRRRARRA